MNEAHENITDQLSDNPRTADFRNQAHEPDSAYEPSSFALPTPNKHRLFPYLVAGTLLVCVAVLGIGLSIVGVKEVRSVGERWERLNKHKEVMLAMNNAAGTTSTGAIPPSYGAFPPNSNSNQSFFASLLPYLESEHLSPVPTSTMPVKTYISPADPFNPGNSNLISYGSNATVLTVGGQPTFPGSFGGRTSGTIVIFDRTAKCGATWSNTRSYLFDTNSSSSPEFGPPDSWSGFGSRATGLVSTICLVGMGDGSARIVNPSNANAGWAWAMDPSKGDPQPSGW